MAIPRDYDLPVTESEYAALVARDTVTQHITQTAMYQITPQDDAIRKRGDDAFRIARERMDAWHRLWEQATTPEAKAAVEAQAAKEEARMRKYRVSVAKIRKSNHSRARFSHNIALPKGKRRLNIDEATAALAQMGYRLGNVRYDPAAGGSVYKVTQPNGSVVDMPAAKLTDFIYQKAQHMRKQLNSLPVPTIANPLNHAEHGAAALAAINAAIKSGNGSEARRLFNLYAHTLSSGEKAAAWASIRKMVGIGANYSRTGTKSTHAATLSGAATYTERLIKSLGFYPETTKFDQARGLLVLEFDEPLVAANAASKLSQEFAKRGSGINRVSIDSGSEQRGDAVVGVVTIHLNDVAARGLNSRTGAKAAFGVMQVLRDKQKRWEKEAQLAESFGNEDAQAFSESMADAYGEGANAIKTMPIEKAVATIRSLRSEAASEILQVLRASFSRTGAKSTHATVDQVADMFKTLSDVERASISGNTAKMQALLKSLAPMVDRDRAKLPKDAVAYYDDMRRKAGMSRTGAKANMGRTEEEFAEDVQNAASILSQWATALHRAMGVRDYERAKFVVNNMKKTIESLAKELARPVTRLSRSGAKAAFGSWANVPTNALEGEANRLLKLWSHTKSNPRTPNALSTVRYEILTLNEELESRGVSMPKLKAILSSSSFSRTGAKSTHAKPTLDEVMKIANELKKMGLDKVAETLVQSWLRETNGGRNMNSRTGAKSTHAAPKFKIGDKVAVKNSSLVGTIAGFEPAAELDNVQRRGKYDNLENKYHLKDESGQSLNWHSEGRLVRASRSSAKSTHAADEIEQGYLRDIAELKGWIEKAYDGLRGSHANQLKARLEEVERDLAGYRRDKGKSKNAADNLRALAVKMGYAPESVTVEGGRGTVKFAKQDGSAGRLAVSLRKPLVGIVPSDRITVADNAVVIEFGEPNA